MCGTVMKWLPESRPKRGGRVRGYNVWGTPIGGIGENRLPSKIILIRNTFCCLEFCTYMVLLSFSTHFSICSSMTFIDCQWSSSSFNCTVSHKWHMKNIKHWIYYIMFEWEHFDGAIKLICLPLVKHLSCAANAIELMCCCGLVCLCVSMYAI